MSILITGGAGFIGANFIKLWVSRFPEEMVVNLDNLTYAGSLQNLNTISNQNHVFVKGDIGDKNLVSSLLKKYKPRAIIHFAAESHVDRSIKDPSLFIQTNINGTFNLLECSQEYYEFLDANQKEKFRFLHISTDEVYGSLELNQPAFTEEHPYCPNNPYAASKASSDHLVHSYFHTYGLPTLITNCSNNYGPYQNTEKLIPLIIQNALNELPITLYGDGKNIRDWIYVTDHCEALIKVLERGNPGEKYNIGATNELTNLELAQHICQKLDQLKPRDFNVSYQDLIVFVKDRSGHDKRYAINANKIKSRLGFSPKINFNSGIEMTIKEFL